MILKKDLGVNVIPGSGRRVKDYSAAVGMKSKRFFLVQSLFLTTKEYPLYAPASRNITHPPLESK